MSHENLVSLSGRAREHTESIEQMVGTIDFYVVGGAVRDALLGLDAADMDFVVVGETPETMEARGFEHINASSFPVFHDSEHEEWALARTENKVGDGYKGFEVETEDVSLREDLERRDLTINAMALDPRGGLKHKVVTNSSSSRHAEIKQLEDNSVLFDPYRGRQDLDDGMLRHVSDAFAEDPLRVLRAARYAARFAVPLNENPTRMTIPEDYENDGYHRFAFDHGSRIESGFTVADETEDMMLRVAPELNRMSRDRIGTEVLKAMEQARNPRRFWQVLRDCGALAVVAPDLDRASIVPAGPDEHHAEGDLFEHTMLVLSEMWKRCEEQDVDGIGRVRRLLMAVAHDLGKVSVADSKGGLHSDDPPTSFPSHAERGRSVARHMGVRLGLPDHVTAAMEDACDQHMRIHDLPMWETERVLDFIDHFEVPDDADAPYQATTDELLDLAHADHQGRYKTSEGIEKTHTDAGFERKEPLDFGYTMAIIQPEFDREPYEERIEQARRAIEQADGYEAMYEGLCDNHRAYYDSNVLHDGDLQTTLSECEDCLSPGPWIGEMVQELRLTVMNDD